MTVVVLTHDPLVSEQVDRTIAIRDDEHETLRRREVDELGDHQVIAEEFAVLDRTGRLQLPRSTWTPSSWSGAYASSSSLTTSASGPTTPPGAER